MNLRTLIGPNASAAFLAALDTKRAPRRFAAEPVAVTGFDVLSIDRQREIGAEELADQRADQRRERDEAGE